MTPYSVIHKIPFFFREALKIQNKKVFEEKMYFEDKILFICSEFWKMIIKGKKESKVFQNEEKENFSAVFLQKSRGNNKNDILFKFFRPEKVED